MSLDAARLAEIRERLDKATPGPWTAMAHNAALAADETAYSIWPPPNLNHGSISTCPPGHAHDADLIANAPTDLADLLTAHDALTAQVAAVLPLRAVAKWLDDGYFAYRAKADNANDFERDAHHALVAALADTAAAAEAFKRQVIDQWLNDNVPERYHYTSGPDGTPETAFGLLCKDALEAMPGNKLNQRRAGAWSYAMWVQEHGNGDYDRWAETERAMARQGQF